MSGFSFRLEIEDLGAGRRIESLSALFADPQGQIYAPIAMALETSTKARFDTGIGPDGESWEPSLRARTEGGKTLLDRGFLRDSVHGSSDPAGLEVGTAHISARVHQFGGEIVAKDGGRLAFSLSDGSFRTPQKVTMPARPFVGLSSDDEGMILRITNRAIEGALQ